MLLYYSPGPHYINSIGRNKDVVVVVVVVVVVGEWVQALDAVISGIIRVYKR